MFPYVGHIIQAKKLSLGYHQNEKIHKDACTFLLETVLNLSILLIKLIMLI